MDNRDNAICVNMADATNNEALLSEDIPVIAVVKMAQECRKQLEAEIRRLNKLLEAKRAELDRLNAVINFKAIDNRRP